MSVHKQIELAVRRAERRDNKRKPKMKVTGKSVFALAKIIHKGK